MRGRQEAVLVGRDRECTVTGKAVLLVSGAFVRGVKGLALQPFSASVFLGHFIDLLVFGRFIPNREGQDLQATYSLLHEDGCPSTPSKTKKRTPHSELHFQKSQFCSRHWQCPFPVTDIPSSGRSKSNVLASFTE